MKTRLAKLSVRNFLGHITVLAQMELYIVKVNKFIYSLLKLNFFLS